jgi:hypothetical protein
MSNKLSHQFIKRVRAAYNNSDETLDDIKHIDSTERALEVGVELVRHLPEPFDEQTSEKLNEIADCLNLLAKFVINEAKYARIKNQQI